MMPKGSLATALQCNDPVLFLEHKSIIFNKGEVPEEEYTIPFGQGAHCPGRGCCHGRHHRLDGS